MSHFTVLVVGDDVEEQLSPFDENIEMPRYKKEEVSEEEKEQMVDYYIEHENFEGTFEECYVKYGNDWNGNGWRKGITGVWHIWSTYNPQSQWDWYSVGGRWSGFFKLKEDATGKMGRPGVFGNEAKKGYVDIIEKNNWDIEGTKNDAKERAMKHYTLLESCFPNGFPKMTILWKDVDYKSEESKEAYHNQEALVIRKDIDSSKLSEEQKKAFAWFDLVDFQCTLEEYGQRAYDNAISTFAMVVDGEWVEKGSMGWFGMSSNEMEQTDWNKIIDRIIDEADDETTFTIVDCHI